MTSLPPHWLVGEANSDAERRMIWSHSWVSVARLEDVADPGSFVTASVAGEPVVVVRGRDLELRALANVCPHRGSIIMEGEGKASALQCPYHAWTFRLDGELAAAPQMPGLELSEYCLPTLAIDVWQGWVFVNLDPEAAPVAEQLSQLEPLVKPFELDAMQ